MLLLSILSHLVSVSSFISGIVFGIFICIATLVHLLKSKPTDESEESTVRHPPKQIVEQSVSSMTSSEVEGLQELVQFLDDFNSPLKNFGGHLERVYVERDVALKEVERSRGSPLELTEFARIEREFHASIAELKDQSKCAKAIAQFLTDLSKVLFSFAKDLNKLSSTARSNSNTKSNTAADTKADMVANNWWQTLHIALDCMSSDQEYLSNHITDDLLNYSTQMSEELCAIEKRLQAEGTRQLQAMKELLALLEAKRKERDRYIEKIAAPPSTLTTQTPEAVLAKRRVRQKSNDEAVSHHRGLVLDAQRDFHQMMTRIRADVQLTVLKAVVDQHAQLMKLCEALERQQSSYQMISKRMRIQLSNAAASLVQMIREEGASSVTASIHAVGHDHSSHTVALDYMSILRGRMLEVGVQGYEAKLHVLLVDLLRLSTTTQFQMDMQARSQQLSPLQTSSPSQPREVGRLDMTDESTSCLAASNPAILPHLPPSFLSAVGTETCVWFNSFSGRVYRDLSHSAYFYHWFCRKASAMLNKGQRPDYVDEFKVDGVKFGKLPPLLLNVRWSPLLQATKPSVGTKVSADDSSPTQTGDSDCDTDNEEDASMPRPQGGERRKRSGGSADPEAEFYAACTADLAFRSGIEFTVTTKYASVPVTLHLHLAECSGPIRFGVRRGYSFFSFVGDPVMRINVRNEIGKGGVFHIKDMPQISDFVVKKLKSFIHRKIVHPNCHKFRLIWPRNWWPEGTETLFMDANTVSSGNHPSSDPQKHYDSTATDGKKSSPHNRSASSDGFPSNGDPVDHHISGTNSQPPNMQAPNSGSSYESMRHTVSAWLQKGKDRRLQRGVSLKGDVLNNEDKAMAEPDHTTAKTDDATRDGDHNRRRKSASDTMKSLLSTARDAKTFRKLSFRTNLHDRSETARRRGGEGDLLSIGDSQRDALKDDGAWDMAVKSISLKYLEGYHESGRPMGGRIDQALPSGGGFFLVRPVAESAVASPKKSAFALPAMRDDVRKSAERSLALWRGGCAHACSTTTRRSEDDSRLIYCPDFDNRVKVARRHSFDASFWAPSITPGDRDRVRSATLCDLRPEVCEAMFRLHVASRHYNIVDADANEEDYDPAGCSRDAISFEDQHAIQQFMDSGNDDHCIDHHHDHHPSEGIKSPQSTQSKIAMAKSKLSSGFKGKRVGGSDDGMVPREGGAMRYISAMFRSSTPGK